MPESGATDGPPRRTRAVARYHRPAPDRIAAAARRVVRGSRASFPSQSAFRAAVLDALRQEEPTSALGGRRLRRLLVSVPGVRLSVRYTEKDDRPLPERCPVCGAELGPILNRTLSGETVVLGRRCRRCDYWTHAAVRVPVRYTVSQASGRRRGATAVRAG